MTMGSSLFDVHIHIEITLVVAKQPHILDYTTRNLLYGREGQCG